jgi:hypothetical protein
VKPVLISEVANSALQLIETGKALRSSNKEGGKTLANAKTRLSSTIPSAIENFHLALDEMECDIVRIDMRPGSSSLTKHIVARKIRLVKRS